MNSTRFRAAKLAMALVFLAATGALWWGRDSIYAPDAAPDTADSATVWYCYVCHKGFSLTARQYEGRTYSGRHPGAPADNPDALARMVTLAPCPACGKGAIRAVRCPTDGTIFDKRSATPACPNCGWKPFGQAPIDE